mgnify:FL=1
MINDLINFLSYDNIYLVVNWGILPFWILLVINPNHALTNFLVQSIIVPFILATTYVYVAYNIFIDSNIFDSFELYSGLDGLYSMFSNEAFLLIFWIHFLTLSLFVGAWIARDSRRYVMPKIITIVSLILTYFTGPVGLFVYWFLRIFFAKKISFND